MSRLFCFSSPYLPLTVSIILHRFKVKPMTPSINQTFTFEELEEVTKQNKRGKKKRKIDSNTSTTTENIEESREKSRKKAAPSLPPYPEVSFTGKLNKGETAENVAMAYTAIAAKEMEVLEEVYKDAPWLVKAGRSWCSIELACASLSSNSQHFHLSFIFNQFKRFTPSF
jgi:hypothetical protein